MPHHAAYDTGHRHQQHQQQQQQQPYGGPAHEMRGTEGYQPNYAAFANGGLQSSSTELGGPQQVGRSSTRLHAPPGGASQIVFGASDAPTSSITGGSRRGGGGGAGGFDYSTSSGAGGRGMSPQDRKAAAKAEAEAAYNRRFDGGSETGASGRASHGASWGGGGGGGGGHFDYSTSSGASGRGMSPKDRKAARQAEAGAAYNRQFGGDSDVGAGGRAGHGAGDWVPGGGGSFNGQQQQQRHFSAPAPAPAYGVATSGYKPNYAAFANGGLQSSSTELKGPQQVARSSTRLHAPPGGVSTITFG